ncbi:Poly(3-hydroxyalkanoate) polymerase subunit PhaC [Bradyrhizobium ivorense]|nr:alpha/beta fold hydrolase [Bradyrhizobium ivorense]VIO80984.1 Poly(3-hydroxyalkanoate) polymerase subunit PhaC [Bradyrhizobium ivorense]
MLDTYWQWFADRAQRPEDEAPLPWTTPNRGALQLPSMRLVDFSRSAEGRPLLVCAPYALHRSVIADFAPGHSLVEVLRNAGVTRLYLTDWRSATSEMRHFSIDTYLAELNVAVDEIGPPVDLAGLCQGGWLSLLYAARFPGKVRRLVLAGSPIDISVPSQIAKMVVSLPQPGFEVLARQGDGIISGANMLQLWSMPLTLKDAEAALQRNLTGSETGRALRDRFERWNRETLDLPGTYYLQVTDWIFRQNRIAHGDFVALGRAVDLAEVKVPVFLLAADNDIVVPRDQALATTRLLGTPPAWQERATEPCGHLGLFMGCKALNNSWRRIARWLQADIGDASEAPRMSA